MRALAVPGFKVNAMNKALFLLTTTALVGVAGCTSLSPTDDPVYLRLTDMEARLMRIERVVDNQSLLQIANQLEQLQVESRELRGELETLRRETESQGARQRELYLDVDRRLQMLEQSQVRAPAGPFDPAPGFGGDEFGVGGGDAGPFAGGALPDMPAGPGAGGAVAAGNDQEAYQTAFNLLQSRQYEPAAEAFRQFLTAHPNSRLADNAQYWLAETYYVRREFEGALPHFQRVLDQYPQSDKTPDALLKIGYCNYELRRWDAARTALQRVTREYPGTTAAQLATQRLQLIAQEVG
jgi:tol-pal system protein YbgF